MIRFLKSSDGNHVILRVSGDPLLVENIDLYRQSHSKIEATLLRERLQEQLDATIRMIRQVSYCMGWKDAKSKKNPKRDYFSSHTEVHDYEQEQAGLV